MGPSRTKQTGSHAVRGAIYAKWQEMEAETSLLGYPTSNEEIAPDYGKHGDGRISHFQNGIISWTEQTGAHEVHGAILRKWMSMGWGLPYLGYPITDEQDAPGGGRISHFKNGTITLTQDGRISISWVQEGCGWTQIICNTLPKRDCTAALAYAT